MSWGHLFFGLGGRIARLQFAIGFLPLALLTGLLHLALTESRHDRLSAAIDLIVAYPEFALMLKRAHDRLISEWIVVGVTAVGVLLNLLILAGLGGTTERPSTLFLAIAIPWVIVALALIADLCFRRGTVGPNRFGDDPLAIPG